MSNRDPEATYSGPTQGILFAIQEWVRQNLRTAVPGIVRAYDASTMRARVQPALRAIVSQPDGTNEAMDRASIYDVPVVWPGGGGFVFHCDLDPGDTVWLMFSERGLAEFKRTLELANPPPMVMFQTVDAVAHPYRSAEIVPAEGYDRGRHPRRDADGLGGDRERRGGLTASGGWRSKHPHDAGQGRDDDWRYPRHVHRWRHEDDNGFAERRPDRAHDEGHDPAADRQCDDHDDELPRS